MCTFNSLNSRYDIIVDRDLLAQGFILNHVQHSISWDRLGEPMHETSAVSSAIATRFSCAHTDTKVYSTYSTKILYAKYDCTSPVDVVHQCAHLSNEDKSKLLQLLQSFSCLFSGKLGRYSHKKISIHLEDPCTPPIFCNPYPVPRGPSTSF